MHKNYLKHKLLLCLLVSLLLCLLSGCGTVDPKDYQPLNEEAYNNFNDLYPIWKNLYDQGLDFYDWGFPEYGYSIGLPYLSTPRKNYDKPIIELFVLPVANDELLSKYAEAVLFIDQYFSSNEEYQRFCKQCKKPFYLEFVARDQAIGQVVLDGTNTAENVKQIIMDGVQESKEEMAASLEEFAKVLENSSVPRDENGDYYFILDSKHYTDSINKIMQGIDQVSPYNPISFEESQHYASASSIMGYSGRFYSVYVDEYGVNSLGQTDFAEGYEYTLSRLYNYLNPYTYGGIESVNNVDLYLNARYKNNPKEDRFVLSVDSSEPVTEAEIVDTLYDFYEKLYRLHEEHGIVAWSDLRITGSCMSASTSGYVFTIEYKLPMNRFYQKEEFAALFYAGTEEENPIIYELYDDCF